jgi:hypothetical protein
VVGDAVTVVGDAVTVVGDDVAVVGAAVVVGPDVVVVVAGEVAAWAGTITVRRTGLTQVPDVAIAPPPRPVFRRLRRTLSAEFPSSLLTNATPRKNYKLASRTCRSKWSDSQRLFRGLVALHSPWSRLSTPLRLR